MLGFASEKTCGYPSHFEAVFIVILLPDSRNGKMFSKLWPKAWSGFESEFLTQFCVDQDQIWESGELWFISNLFTIEGRLDQHCLFHEQRLFSPWQTAPQRHITGQTIHGPRLDPACHPERVILYCCCASAALWRQSSILQTCCQVHMHQSGTGLVKAQHQCSGAIAPIGCTSHAPVKCRWCLVSTGPVLLPIAIPLKREFSVSCCPGEGVATSRFGITGLQYWYCDEGQERGMEAGINGGSTLFWLHTPKLNYSREGGLRCGAMCQSVACWVTFSR